MSEYIGLIIGLMFFIILFGADIFDFLDNRRKQKFQHERKMAQIAASARLDSLVKAQQAALAKDDGLEDDA
jgi:hypothetical protein